MKPIIIACYALLPALLHSQGTPSSGNSALWQMRKKVQQRSAQRTGTYLEQMNQALQSGDAEGAETAMKSAVAQGTLTQAQINDARGRIAGMVSQQRQAMVAAARAKEDAARQESEARQMASAQRDRQAITAPTISSSSSSFAPSSSPDSLRTESEEDRFRALWRGKTANFLVLESGSGAMLSFVTILLVQDPASGKKFRVSYDVGIEKGLIDSGTLEGSTLTIGFNANGAPAWIKNPANGRSTPTNNGWRVTGYGW